MKQKSLFKTMLLLCALVAGSGSVWAQSDYSSVYTSNVALPSSGSCKVKIGNTEYNGIKLGSNGNGGSATISVPAGTKYIHLHVAAWNNKSTGFSYKVGNGNEISISNITSNSGIANNSPFTFSGDASTTAYYKVITLANTLEDATNITFKSSKERVVFWGLNTEEETKDVTSLSIKTAPTKTRYEAGETLDMTGFVLDADGTDVTTGYTMTMDGLALANNAALSSAGKKTITVTYGGKEVTQDISVGLVTGIAVTTPPTKTSYDTGDSFDPTNMVVTASLSTGEDTDPDTWTKDVTSYTIDPKDNLAPANTFVTITYATKTTTQAITVTDVAVTSISLKKSTIIEKGKTETLTPTILPANATNKGVTWESDNTDVATVTDAGVVTAVVAGTANITVTTDDGNYEATCIVTVVGKKGGKDFPFTVAEVMNGDASGQSNIWVKGFIVGSWTNNKFDAENLVNSNLALADEYNSTTTIPVELTSDSGLRSNWGPKSNPGLVNVAQVLVKGNGQSYFGKNAIKGASEIEKVGEMVKITDAEYATHSSDVALDYGAVGITAYTATDGEASVKLNEITSGKVPANTPVVLYKAGANGTAINVPVIASAEEITAQNDLHVVGAGGLTGAEGVYVLAKPTGNEVGFYRWDSSATLDEGKIYLKYIQSGGSDARQFLPFSSDAQGISATLNNNEIMNNVVFDLQGRRVAKPAKGLYIMDGRKVMVK